MRNQSPHRLLALVIVSALFSLGCSSSRRSSLQLKSRSQSASGDSAPLAQATFHLLDVDPITLVMTGADEHTPWGGEVYRAHPNLRGLAGLMSARRQAAYSLGPDVFLFLEQSRPLWEAHVIRSVRTDMAGNARLDDLKPGSYWLMGYSETPEAGAFWVQQVDIKEGTHDVVLERSNALYFK